jgi:hypothetical protein
MQQTWIKATLRIFLGLVIGVAASAAFLMVALRLWESLITPYAPYVTETRKTVIFLVEIGIYCVAALVFGIVNSLFVSRGRGRDLQVIVGASLALIVLIPFTLIEGHFVPATLVITLAISAACGFFIKVGQPIVFRFRKIEG